MDFKDREQYDIARPDEIATIENVTQIWDEFLAQCGFKDESWRDLRESMYRFCLDEIEHCEPHGSLTVGQMGIKAWAFYQGYMSCHHYWDRVLRKHIKENWFNRTPDDYFYTPRKS